MVSLSKEKCLQWPPELAVYDSPGCLRSGGKLFHRCEGPVSETAGRPVDSKRSSVSRTHLSDTNVGDELTVVDHIAWSMAGRTGRQALRPWTRRAAAPEASGIVTLYTFPVNTGLLRYAR